MRCRRISPSIHVTLGHGKSGGSGKETSVPIFMLVPENIKTIYPIKPLWNASQVT